MNQLEQVDEKNDCSS